MPSTKTEQTASRAVSVVAPGWWALADATAFYPDDLPDDWRLGYFANEHHGVYLPATAWCAAPAAVLTEWRDAVYPGFQFFLEWPVAASADARQRAEAALQDTLAGWVRWTDADGVGELLGAGAPAPAPWGHARVCPPALLGNLRAGAAWLRAQATAPATLVILPQATATQLAQWEQLLQLLGFAAIEQPAEAVRPA